MYINIRFRRPFYFLLIILLCFTLLFFLKQDLFIEIFGKLLNEIKYFFRYILRRSFWRLFLWNT